jgi:hypothetical protein
VLQTVIWPRFTTWLDQLPRPVAIAVAQDLDYLARHARAAALPYARHRIQASAHFPDMSETRTEIDDGEHRWVLRCLTAFANHDQALIVCLGGDKATWSAQHPGQDWYETWIPVADEITTRIKKEKGWR